MSERAQAATQAARLDVLNAVVAVQDDVAGLVELVATARDRPEAAARLRERYGISAQGADAVLDMQLGRLTQVQRERIVEERDARAQELGET